MRPCYRGVDYDCAVLSRQETRSKYKHHRLPNICSTQTKHWCMPQMFYKLLYVRWRISQLGGNKFTIILSGSKVFN